MYGGSDQTLIVYCC